MKFFWRLLLMVCCVFLSFQVVNAETFKTKLTEANVSVQLSGRNEVIELGVRKLPWRWDAEFPKQSGVGHFTLKKSFTAEEYASFQAGGKGIAFSALNIGNRYRFRLNSSDWQSVGWGERTTQYRSMPRWHVLPLAQLKKGDNTLEFELRLEPVNDAGFTTIELGDIDMTFNDYQRGNNIRHFGALVVVIIAMLIGFFALAMWYVSREKMFALAGSAGFLFALRQTAIFVDYPFVLTWIWNAFFASLFALYVGFICQISSLLIQKKAPKLAKFTEIFLWISAPFLFFGYALGDARFYKYCLILMLVLSALHMLRLLWFSVHTRDWNLRLYTVASFVAVIFGLYDFIMIQTTPEGLGKIRLSTFSALLFNLMLAIVIVRKFISIQQESMRSRLEAGIQQEQAKHGERQRIMKELHDSVGSQLVGLLSMIKGGAAQKDIETLTTDALQELRIAVDAIQPVNGNLAAVLATLRHRLQPRLDTANLRLIWQVDDLPKLNNLTPQGIQNIQRILLEAFTNIMHHAKAKTIIVKASHFPSQGLVKISISDDGLGFESSKLESAGQGLRNMKSRAESIGATIHFEQGKASGTCMNLLVPDGQTL
jgi:signal transduction histidine kinase